MNEKNLFSILQYALEVQIVTSGGLEFSKICIFVEVIELGKSVSQFPNFPYC